MRLRLTPRAAQDLLDIAEYLQQHSPAGAMRVRSAILESIQRAVRFPASGRRQSVGDVRKIVTRRYRYVLYYIVDLAADELVILAIRHPARESERSDL